MISKRLKSIRVTYIVGEVILIILGVSCFGQTYSQTKGLVEINHVFVTVDSTTYHELFRNDFLTNVLALTRESSSATKNDSWTGKYIYGRNAFLEFFSAAKVRNLDAQLGDRFADLGLAFKTRKSGDLDRLKRRMDSLKLPIHVETTEAEVEGKPYKWNHILFVDRPQLHDNFRPYVEEKTKDLLRLRGFTEEEISQELTEEAFRERVRGRKYTRLFDRIRSIQLNLTAEEFGYLGETLHGLGFSQKEHTFSNGELLIECSVSKEVRFRIRSIELSLSEHVVANQWRIGHHLTLITEGQVARFTFNYD